MTEQTSEPKPAGRPAVVLVERYKRPGDYAGDRFEAVGPGEWSANEGDGDETIRVHLTPDKYSRPGKTSYTATDDSGERLGRVYQASVNHDRKPRGSRIVTSRTRSNRWHTNTPFSVWSDTRSEAVADLIADLHRDHE